MHTLLLFLTLLMPVSAEPPTDADALRALGRADVYALKAHGRWIDIQNYLVEEYKKGRRELSRSEWDTKVIPLAEKAVMFMDMAIEEIESVLPEDCQSQFWHTIKWDVLSSWKSNTNHLRDPDDIFDSEYLLTLAMYPSYIDMYHAIFHGKFTSIEKARIKLEETAHIE